MWPCWRCHSWSSKFSCVPLYNLSYHTLQNCFVNLVRCFLFRQQSWFQQNVLILLHSTSVLRGPSAPSETTLSRPRSIQLCPADTSAFNHSWLVERVLSCVYNLGTHTLWLSGRSPTGSQKATDRSAESQSHLARNKSPTETCYKNLGTISCGIRESQHCPI